MLSKLLFASLSGVEIKINILMRQYFIYPLKADVKGGKLKDGNVGVIWVGQCMQKGSPRD